MTGPSLQSSVHVPMSAIEKGVGRLFSAYRAALHVGSGRTTLWQAGKKGRGGRRAVLASYLSQKLALAQFSGSSIVLDRTARQARLTVSPLTTLHFQLSASN